MRQTSIVALYVEVPTGTILWVLDGLGVQSWVLSFGVLVQLGSVRVLSCRMKLFPWLLHVGEPTIVVVNVGVSTTTIGIVVDASIPHHLQTLVVLSTNGCESLVRHMFRAR